MPSHVPTRGRQALALDSPVSSTPTSLFGPWPWPKRCAWIVVVLLVTAWRGASMLDVMRPEPGIPLDFFQEWASARNYLEGRPIYLSQSTALQLYLGFSAAAAAQALIQVNAHPPPATFVVLPLGRMSYPNAALVFNVASIALLVASVWLVLRQLAIPLSSWDVLPSATLLLLSNPFRQQVTQGQWNLVLLFLITAGWFAQRNDRPWLAGAAIGAAASLKPFPAFLGLYFLVRRDWRATTGLVATLVASCAFSAVVLGPDAWLTYVRDVIPRVSSFRSAWVNASLPGLWSKLFNPRDVGGVTIPILRSETLETVLVAATCVAVTALVIRAIRDAQSRARQDMAFALCTIAMLLVWPLTWPHSFLLLLLPVTLLWRQEPLFYAYRLTLVVCFAVLWVGEDWFWYVLMGTRWFEPVVATPWQTLTALSFHCYALVGLFVIALRYTSGRTYPAAARRAP